MKKSLDYDGFGNQPIPIHGLRALENACQPRKTVDIRPLKAFVCANYPKDSALYEVVVTDEDFQDVGVCRESRYILKIV